MSSEPWVWWPPAHIAGRSGEGSSARPALAVLSPSSSCTSDTDGLHLPEKSRLQSSSHPSNCKCPQWCKAHRAPPEWKCTLISALNSEKALRQCLVLVTAVTMVHSGLPALTPVETISDSLHSRGRVNWQPGDCSQLSSQVHCPQGKANTWPLCDPGPRSGAHLSLTPMAVLPTPLLLLAGSQKPLQQAV